MVKWDKKGYWRHKERSTLQKIAWRRVVCGCVPLQWRINEEKEWHDISFLTSWLWINHFYTNEVMGLLLYSISRSIILKIKAAFSAIVLLQKDKMRWSSLVNESCIFVFLSLFYFFSNDEGNWRRVSYLYAFCSWWEMLWSMRIIFYLDRSIYLSR